MNDQYRHIKSELELTKKELLERLNRSNYNDRENFHSVATIYERERNYLLDQHIHAELEDVNRALLKMEFGLYGLCEQTGQQIPYEKLKVLPTVRTMTEATTIGYFPFMTEQYEQLQIK